MRRPFGRSFTTQVKAEHIAITVAGISNIDNTVKIGVYQSGGRETTFAIRCRNFGQELASFRRNISASIFRPCLFPCHIIDIQNCFIVGTIHIFSAIATSQEARITHIRFQIDRSGIAFDGNTADLCRTNGITQLIVRAFFCFKQRHSRIPTTTIAVSYRTNIQRIRTASTLTHRTKHKGLFIRRLTENKTTIDHIAVRRARAVTIACNIFQNLAQSCRLTLIVLALHTCRNIAEFQVIRIARRTITENMYHAVIGSSDQKLLTVIALIANRSNRTVQNIAQIALIFT